VGRAGGQRRDQPGEAHPRSCGTFRGSSAPGVRERGLLTPPPAVFKMTGGSTAVPGLTDRGVRGEGEWGGMMATDREPREGDLEPTFGERIVGPPNALKVRR
jgi:hypothetical protein